MRVASVFFMVGLGSAGAEEAAGFKDRLIGEGVTPSATYVGDAAANVAGGAKRGQTYAGLLHLQVALDGERIAAMPGLTAWVDAMWVNGGQPGQLVGDAQGVSNIAAPPALRLYEAWTQFTLPGGRVSVLVGRYDLNTEFDHLTTAGLFFNSSFGVGPEFSQSGFAGPSIFPNTSLGVRLAYQPDPDFALLGAIMDGAPVDRTAGAPGAFDPHNGVLLVAEAAFLTHAATDEAPPDHPLRIGRLSDQPAYENKVAVGGWYYTATFNDLSAIGANGAPVRRSGEGGIYATLDRLLYQAGDRRVSGFVQIGLANQEIGRFGSYLGAGLVAGGLIGDRPDDQLGIAFAMARNGSHYLAAQQQSGLPVKAAETAIETTYLAQIRPWLALQPDVQYVIHPNTDPTLRDATVVQLRVALTY
jgi:porin